MRAVAAPTGVVPVLPAAPRAPVVAVWALAVVPRGPSRTAARVALLVATRRARRESWSALSMAWPFRVAGLMGLVSRALARHGSSHSDPPRWRFTPPRVSSGDAAPGGRAMFPLGCWEYSVTVSPGAEGSTQPPLTTVAATVPVPASTPPSGPPVR